MTHTEAFWPEGAWATWYLSDVFDTHTYEITDEKDDLRNHRLLFWTAVALKLFAGGGRGRRGLGRALTRLLFIVWGGVA